MKAPWEKRTWIDTFVHNKAFETHAVSMILAMNEIREEKKASKARKLKSDLHYVDTVSMLLGLDKGEK